MLAKIPWGLCHSRPGWPGESRQDLVLRLPVAHPIQRALHTAIDWFGLYLLRYLGFLRDLFGDVCLIILRRPAKQVVTPTVVPVKFKGSKINTWDDL